jgi:hypothetical protein
VSAAKPSLLSLLSRARSTGQLLDEPGAGSTSCPCWRWGGVSSTAGGGGARTTVHRLWMPVPAGVASMSEIRGCGGESRKPGGSTVSSKSESRSHCVGSVLVTSCVDGLVVGSSMLGHCSGR